LKRLIVIVVLASTVLINYAQVKYSISGGINLTDLRNEWGMFDNPKILPRFGYSFGCGIEIPVVTTFFIKNQLNIVSKNYAFDTEDFYGAGTEGYDRYSIVYLDIPVMAGYHFKEINFFTGPYFDFCLGGTNQHNLEYFDGNKDEGTYGIDASGKLKSSEITDGIFPLQDQNFLDAGILLGIGHANENFSLELSYAYGLVNIFPKVDGSQINRNDYSLYTRVITVRLNIFI
jgi:hypothetical protein